MPAGNYLELKVWIKYCKSKVRSIYTKGIVGFDKIGFIIFGFGVFTTAKVKQSNVFKIDGVAFGLKGYIALGKELPCFGDPVVFALNHSAGSPVLIAHFGVGKTTADLGALVF